MLILYLYQLGLVPISRTLISDEIFQLIAQLFVYDTDLKIDNNGNETAIEVILRAQIILTAWHHALQFTSGELKLDKCYWTMQDFEWKDNIAKLIPYKPADLFLTINGNPQTILYLPPQQSQTLVGVSTNLVNDNSTIFSIY